MRRRTSSANSLIISVFAISVFLSAMPATAAAKPTRSRTKTIERSFECRGRTVSVKSSSADIEVGAASGDRAVLTAKLEYWSSDEEWMKGVEENFDVLVEETDQRISIEPTEVSRLDRRGWLSKMLGFHKVNYSLQITLRLPKGTPLELENRYGGIEVRDVGGTVSVDNTSGNVTVAGATGPVEIDNRYGDLTTERIKGDLTATVSSGTIRVEGVSGTARIVNRYGGVTLSGVGGGLDLDNVSGKVRIQGVGGGARVKSSYGSVEASGIRGRLDLDLSSGNLSLDDLGDRADIRSTYGDVEIAGVDGELALRSYSGAVRIRNARGGVRVESSYGDVLLEQIQGNVEVTNSSGGVTLESVTGSAEVKTSYAPVRVRHLGGSLHVSASSSGVSVEDAGGPVEVDTSYAGVVIHGAGGAVSVRNKSGRVEVGGLKSGALTASHRIETSYDDVLFDWPKSAGLSFTAETTYGSVQSDFMARTLQSSSHMSLEGRVGDAGEGHATLTISVRSGNITLRKR